MKMTKETVWVVKIILGDEINRPNLAIKGSSSKVFAKFSKSSSESASDVSEYSASIERIQDSIFLKILLYKLVIVSSHY